MGEEKEVGVAAGESKEGNIGGEVRDDKGRSDRVGEMTFDGWRDAW